MEPSTPMFPMTRGRYRILVFLFTVALYANGAGNPFVDYDDPLIVRNSKMESWSSFRGLRETFFDLSGGVRVEHGREYLPVRDLSASVQYRAFGDHPLPYHLVQIALFAAASVLFFEFSRVLGLTEATAFIGSLLFAAHPIHVESVTWLSGHKDLLSLFFLLLCLYAYVGGRIGTSIGSYALAIGSKYPAILAPLFLPLIDRIRNRPIDWRRLGPFLGLGVGGYLVATAVGRDLGYPHVQIVGGLSDWLRNLPVVFDAAFSRLLIPSHLQLFHPFEPARTWVDPRIWRGTAELGLILIASVRYARASPILPLSAALLVFNLAPMFRAPRGQFLADRYLLFSSIGFSLLWALALSRIQKPTLRWAVVLVVVSAYAVTTVRQNRVWASEQTLWEHAARGEEPVDPRVWNNLAAIYLTQEDWGNAAKAHEMYLLSADERDPEYPAHLHTLGYVQLKRGKRPEAEALLRRLKRIPSAEGRARDLEHRLSAFDLKPTGRDPQRRSSATK
jgi:hypothetical protein